jgi:hypothetical protein
MTEEQYTEGVRFDTGKPRYDLIDAYGLEELAKVYTMGAEKYEENNWRKGMKWSRVFASTLRHLYKFWRAKQFGTSEIDEESGLPHLAHALWNVMTLLNYSHFKLEFDDRPA